MDLQVAADQVIPEVPVQQLDTQEVLVMLVAKDSQEVPEPVTQEVQVLPRAMQVVKDMMVALVTWVVKDIQEVLV